MADPKSPSTPKSAVTPTSAVTASDMLAYCRDLPMRSAVAGDVLIEEGVRHGGMLVLVSGAVAVERSGVTFARIDIAARRSASSRVGTVGDWRARIVAECGGLENRYGCKLIKGSNPLPSAHAVVHSADMNPFRVGVLL